MQRFTQLFLELDASTRIKVKVAALVRYFQEAPPEDAAWALWFLTGHRFPALVKTKALRRWAGQVAELPGWLVAESYEAVGDLAETLALLLPEPGTGTELGLAAFVEKHILPLRDWAETMQMPLLREAWSTLSTPQRFLFHKLITGAFRVGVQRTLVVRALSELTGIEAPVLEHRLMGDWPPTAEVYERLLDPQGQEDDRTARPYPFYLASPLEPESPKELGPRDGWQIEWKWDGIRAQLLRRGAEVVLWSRGEEIVTPAFPEIVEAAARLPGGTVLDGEILAWREGHPLPFSVLQRRLGRKTAAATILCEAPVRFIAYDCLEVAGQDIREKSLEARREQLDALVKPLESVAFGLSPVIVESEWEAIEALWREARERGVEGFILKRSGSPYRVGRLKGDWWKWKSEPYTVDAVMISAQTGHGRRAGRYTDYAFAVRDGEELVPVAKAYSGLDDKEIALVDRFVRQHTLAKHGPVRTIEAKLVFELGFEGIAASTRHKSGVALRFPRILRWRHDKKPEEVDTLDTLKELIARTSLKNLKEVAKPSRQPETRAKKEAAENLLLPGFE